MRVKDATLCVSLSRCLGQVYRMRTTFLSSHIRMRIFNSSHFLLLLKLHFDGVVKFRIRRRFSTFFCSAIVATQIDVKR